MRKRLLVLFTSAAVVGALLLLPVLWSHTRWTGPLELILLSLTAVPLGLMGINIRGSVIYADVGPQLVACLFLGPAAAILVRLVIGIGAIVTRRPPALKVVLAGSHAIFSVMGAYWTLRAMGLDAGAWAMAGTVEHAGALLAAAVAFATIQTTIETVFTAVALYLIGERASPWEALRPDADENRWQFLTLVVTVPAAAAYAGLYVYWGVAGAFLMTLLTITIGWLLNRQWYLTQQAQALQDRASRDPLTGLYNRAHLMELLQRHLARCGQAQRPLALLFVDLDDFGAVNDRHGHLSGDQVLTQVARGLEQGVGGRGTVARYAGDEFVVLLPGVAQPEAEMMAASIRRALSPVTCSIGIAVFPGDGTDALTLLDVADRRMYTAKGANGRPQPVETKTAAAGAEAEPRVEAGPAPRRAARAGPAVNPYPYRKD